MKGIHKNKFSLFIIIFMIIIGVSSPYISPYSPNDFSYNILLAPSKIHPLGTDEMGHDILSILLSGFRTTIYIAVTSSILSTIIGTFAAILAAYYGGILEKIISSMTDLFIIIPEILIILIFAVYASPSTLNTIIAISLFSWSKVAKILLVRAKASLESDKIMYTIMLKGHLLDIFKKLWYEIAPAVITMFILQCSKAAVYESSLSFLGLGNPTAKTWGKLIKSALAYEGIFYDGCYIWYLMPPIICIIVFVICLSTISSSFQE